MTSLINFVGYAVMITFFGVFFGGVAYVALLVYKKAKAITQPIRLALKVRRSLKRNK